MFGWVFASIFGEFIRGGNRKKRSSEQMIFNQVDDIGGFIQEQFQVMVNKLEKSEEDIENLCYS